MREIRFRAWDIENKVMCDVSHIFIANMVIPQTIMVSVGSEMKHCPDDAILMQFTGLHDKNGKEIWEGDIVNIDRQDSFPSYNKAIIGYGDNYGSFLLQYTKPINPKGVLAQGNSITSNNGKILYGYCTGWEIEVIGNIYEHPELL